MHQEESIIVIGGGASGMMAAGRAAEMGAHVILLERSRKTWPEDTRERQDALQPDKCQGAGSFHLYVWVKTAVFSTGHFITSFVKICSAFLSRYGVETKIERGGRVFPVSDRAEDVVSAFEKYLIDHGVEICRHSGSQASKPATNR